MSKWDKNLGKYTKTYVQRLNKKKMPEEERMVYKTIALMTVNSLIYFVGGLQEAKSEFTGIKSKRWTTQLNQMTEEEIHGIIEHVTHQYFEESLEAGKESEFPLLKLWRDDFEKFMKQKTGDHLVDNVFRLLKIENASRNDMPVMTFVEIISGLYERLDKAVQNVLIDFLKRHAD